MPYEERRVFYGKVGKAGPLVEQVKEMFKLAESAGPSHRWRVLTDHLSGRTDRVVMEWEVDELSDFAAFDQAARTTVSADALTKWERAMNELIEYAETDTWQVH